MKIRLKQEPRRNNRVPVRIPVLLCSDPQGAKVKGSAVVVNLTSKGVGFETESELKSGDLLFLKISLPISVACQVRYVRGKSGSDYRCGATIERIGFLDRMKLKDFVKNQVVKIDLKKGVIK